MDKTLDIMSLEKVHLDKKYIHRKTGSGHLLIILNIHNQGEKYFGLKQISDGIKDMDLLFLVDSNNKYYLDDDEGARYKDIIRNIISEYDVTNVSIFGTSMAGFAALHFGMLFSLNVIAINPQIRLDTACNLAWPDLKITLSTLESKIDLIEIIKERYNGQPLYLVFGKHRLDLQAHNEFNSIDINDMSLVIRTVNSVEHKFFLTNLKSLSQIHHLLIQNRKINEIIST